MYIIYGTMGGRVLKQEDDLLGFTLEDEITEDTVTFETVEEAVDFFLDNTDFFGTDAGCTIKRAVEVSQPTYKLEDL